MLADAPRSLAFATLVLSNLALIFVNRSLTIATWRNIARKKRRVVVESRRYR